jgi:serine/threonine protein kinase
MVGRTIAHYRILSQLGSGGMGVVYAAEDQRLGRPVALKFVPEELARDHQAIERLRSEARAASSLNHANICTIYDIGEHEGRPFIVMELLKGQTLRERLTSGLLRVHEILDIGIQVADALDSAHARGVIHRDIKPANLFLNDRGQIKILDFGLAKLLTRQTTSMSTAAQTTDLTGAGMTLGTVAYMSPEQVTGERLDGRTDLFSFGVVLYECVTGRQPFTGKTSAVIFSEILNRTPSAPTIFNPEVPIRLQEVIATCLEKDREMRYQEAAGLRADLKRLKRDLESGQAGISRTDVRIGSVGVPTISGGPSHQSDSAAKSSIPQIPQSTMGQVGKRGLTFGVVAVLIALIAGTIYFLEPRTPAPPVLQTAPAQPPTAPPQPPTAAAPPPTADVRPTEEDAASARRARVDEAVANARARLAAGDTNGAAAALEAARAIDSAAPAVVELTRLVNQFRTQADAARRAAELSRQAPTPPPQRQAPRESLPPDAEVAKAPPAPVTAPPTPSAPTTPNTATAPAQPVAPPQATQAPEVSVPTTSAAPAPPAPAPVEPAPRPTPPPPAPETPVARREATPPSTAPANGDDEAAIRRIVATYARAIETKDVALFRSVKPNLSAAEQRRIEDGFRAVSSQRVNITILSIDRRENDASVRLRRRDTIDAGGRQQTTESQQTMTLVRTGAGWVIGEIGR